MIDNGRKAKSGKGGEEEEEEEEGEVVFLLREKKMCPRQKANFKKVRFCLFVFFLVQPGVFFF